MKKMRLLTYERVKTYLSKIGFTEVVHDEGGNAYDAFKVNNDVVYRISLGYHNFSNNFRINAKVSSEIISHNVNCILGKFTQLRKSGEDTLSEFPNYNRNWCDAALDPIEDMSVETQAEFDAALAVLATHVETYILPFFAKVPNLQTINDEIIDKVPQEDYTKYIKGSTTFKVLIIMKLCGNVKYADYKAWAIDAYQKAIPRDPERWTKLLETLQSLISFLDEEKHLEIT